MIPQPPDIDPRRRRHIIEQARKLAGFYTPEWRATQEGDPGVALLEAAARMLDGLVRRLNRTPEKHFVEYLNLLGVELIPPRPAKAPLTFQLSAGAEEPVPIPARLQVLGEPEEGGEPLVFETRESFSATPARLRAAVSVRPRGDSIFDHGKVLEGGSEELFGGPGDLQSHVLYLGDERLFQVSSEGTIRLEIRGRHIELLAGERLSWEWSSGGGEWTRFREASSREGGIDLVKGEGEVAAQEVRGVETRWIRLSLDGPLGPEDPLLGVKVESLEVAPEMEAMLPEAVFSNDLPVLLPVSQDSPLRPFGLRPRQGDVFYVASGELFSKHGSRAFIKVKLIGLSQPRDVTISWEYWNGRGWRPLKVEDGTEKFDQSGEIAFTVPDDLEPVEIAGVESRWVRARLAQGDYGQEIFKGGEAPDLKNVREPIVAELTVRGEVKASPPSEVWTLNNRMWKRAAGAVRPFRRMADEAPSLYLGFDGPPAEGAISLFFQFQEQAYRADERPEMLWQYLRRDESAGAEWAALEVSDGSDEFTETGVVRFIGPEDFARRSLWGHEGLHWLRAVDENGVFRAVQGRLLERIRATLGPEAPARRIAASIRRREFEAPDVLDEEGGSRHVNAWLSLHRDYEEMVAGGAPAPILQAVFVNTAWAEQAESIERETLGSSSGVESQEFLASRVPIIEERVWVDEADSLSEEERRTLLDDPAGEVDEERDDQGRLLRFWVRWRRVEDMLDTSGGEDRAYTIDRASGRILFGDGLHGAIPPVGRGNIRASYRTGGGAAGNLPAESIASPRTSLPFVDRVYNPLAAEGGSDTESPERARERGPQRIRHRGRAVASDDFEWLALEASARVARSKCLPNRDEARRPRTGSVAVIVVPRSPDERPKPRLGLKRRVRRYLRERAANVIAMENASVEVIGPVYYEVRVRAEIVPLDIASAAQLEEKALALLKQYLHPLEGGPRGQGWEFGRLPCRSECFSLLESIPEADYVDRLQLLVTPEGDEQRQNEMEVGAGEEVRIPSEALIFSGQHRIIVKPAPSKEG